MALEHLPVINRDCENYYPRNWIFKVFKIVEQRHQHSIKTPTGKGLIPYELIGDLLTDGAYPVPNLA